ncbi:hypothetical protein LY76DRAFT_591859 [Colletotrichum caudatum]|nr:hypothetical protein LY76DRAFT_591859 [Colletotrichum caudatum]
MCECARTAISALEFQSTPVGSGGCTPNTQTNSHTDIHCHGLESVSSKRNMVASKI